MMKLGKSIACALARPTLKVKKYSPEILVGVGIVGLVAAAVRAVYKTSGDEFCQIIDDHRIIMDKIAQAKAIAAENPTKIDEDGNEVETYSLMSQRTDTFVNYRKTTVRMAKFYWPQISIAMLSVVSILSGFTIIRRRNIALMAAYNIVDQAFKGYRERVKAELGEEMDTHFMYDTEIKQLGTKTVEMPDGTTKKVKQTEQVLKGEVVSMYARLFDENNAQFSSAMPKYNWLYIKKKRDYLNDLLHSRGHVFLNEVYDELGFDHTQAGAVVGWVSKLHGGEGDNYISFGPWCESINDVEEEGPHGSILLDFNVDGVVYDMI